MLPVELWHHLLCGVAVVNLVLLARRLRSDAARETPPDRYERRMRRLAIPWVFECSWRAVFAALYLQRYAWYDTRLNAILVNRCLACVGELCYTGQARRGVGSASRVARRRRGRTVPRIVRRRRLRRRRGRAARRGSYVAEDRTSSHPAPGRSRWP